MHMAAPILHVYRWQWTVVSRESRLESSRCSQRQAGTDVTTVWHGMAGKMTMSHKASSCAVYSKVR